MATIADYFCGTVSVSKYAQIVNVEIIPKGYIVDGVFHQTGATRNLYVGKFTEKRFYFEGVSATMAKSLPSSATVTDIDGTTYTVSFVESITDGSQGTASFETYNNSVNIGKMSPHLRTIEVVERRGTLEVQSKDL